MNDRFRQILSLALHPETGEGEAAAALAAARRLVAKEGLDKVMAAEASPKERIVYRDVYRTEANTSPYSQYKVNGDLKMRATSVHGILEVAFKCARNRNVVLMINSATTTNKLVTGSTLINLDVYGNEKNVKAWFDDIRDVIEQNNKNTTDTNNNTNNNTTNANKTETASVNRKPGFWSKLFGIQ